MGIPIGMCNSCKEYTVNITIPCCDYFSDKNNKEKIIKNSIVLPNGNNMNSYYDNNLNLNLNLNQNKEDEGFNISLSPISKGKKNNINFNQMNINYDSSNNKYNSSNIDTNKIYEPIKLKKENEQLKEQSYVKEESDSQEDNNSRYKFRRKSFNNISIHML